MRDHFDRKRACLILLVSLCFVTMRVHFDLSFWVQLGYAPKFCIDVAWFYFIVNCMNSVSRGSLTFPFRNHKSSFYCETVELSSVYTFLHPNRMSSFWLWIAWTRRGHKPFEVKWMHFDIETGDLVSCRKPYQRSHVSQFSSRYEQLDSKTTWVCLFLSPE